MEPVYHPLDSVPYRYPAPIIPLNVIAVPVWEGGYCRLLARERVVNVISLGWQVLKNIFNPQYTRVTCYYLIMTTNSRSITSLLCPIMPPFVSVYFILI